MMGLFSFGKSADLNTISDLDTSKAPGGVEVSVRRFGGTWFATLSIGSEWNSGFYVKAEGKGKRKQEALDNAIAVWREGTGAEETERARVLAAIEVESAARRVAERDQ